MTYRERILFSGMLADAVACDLGYFDDETIRVEPDQELSRRESVTYVFGINRHPCDRNRPRRIGRDGGIRTHDPLTPSHFS
jgi:hypothetical protein